MILNHLRRKRRSGHANLLHPVELSVARNTFPGFQHHSRGLLCRKIAFRIQLHIYNEYSFSGPGQLLMCLIDVFCVSNNVFLLYSWYPYG